MWGVVDVSTEDGDKYVLDAADSSREKVRMKGGQSREVGSKESQREGVEERREASAREG